MAKAPSQLPRAQPKVHLIECDDAEPTVTVKPGMRFEVSSTAVVNPAMQPAGKKIAARLCGGTSTCLALVEI